MASYEQVFLAIASKNKLMTQEEASRTLKSFKSQPDDGPKMTIEQMVWRRNKIASLGEVKYMQEYPANSTEAFQTSGEDCLIKAEQIMRARQDKDADEYGPLVVGVDLIIQGIQPLIDAWVVEPYGMTNPCASAPRGTPG